MGWGWSSTGRRLHRSGLHRPGTGLNPQVLHLLTAAMGPGFLSTIAKTPAAKGGPLAAHGTPVRTSRKLGWSHSAVSDDEEPDRGAEFAESSTTDAASTLSCDPAFLFPRRSRPDQSTFVGTEAVVLRWQRHALSSDPPPCPQFQCRRSWTSPTTVTRRSVSRFPPIEPSRPRSLAGTFDLVAKSQASREEMPPDPRRSRGAGGSVCRARRLPVRAPSWSSLWHAGGAVVYAGYLSLFREQLIGGTTSPASSTHGRSVRASLAGCGAGRSVPHPVRSEGTRAGFALALDSGVCGLSRFPAGLLARSVPGVVATLCWSTLRSRVGPIAQLFEKRA